MKICVIGLGYVGLPTAAIFAKEGFHVLGVDINERAVSLINEGKVHLEETGLAEMVNASVKAGKLRAAMKVEPADAFIIAVPTPNHEDHTANLSYVQAALEAIEPHVQKHNIIIVESTIPPRTIDDLVAPFFRQSGWNVEQDLYLAHCPERVLPGRILIELVENTRIVGGYTPEAAHQAAELYRQVVSGKVIETKAVSAEMAKLMENTYRDVNIALANELTKISDKLEIDALEVIQLANLHPRVHFHLPGPGVGGHCIPIDPYFVIEKASEEAPLMAKAREINNSMPLFVVDHVAKLVPPQGKIAILGLTYKGNTDDTRESPAMNIIQLLNQRGFALAYHDPHVSQQQVGFMLASFEQAVQDADCILVLADHHEFKQLDEQALLKGMRSPIVFDTRNCVQVQHEDIQYYNYSNLYEITQ